MTGAGSRWTNGSYLLIGLSGDGALAVSDSGEALSDYLYVGTIGRGALTISAGGSVSATSAAEIGLFSGSNGTLWIGDGGTLSSTSSGIGSGAGATGAVTVTGPGSQWISNDALMVGDQGKGALTVSDGGSVSAPTLQLANAAGSVGTINIGAASGAPAAAAGTLAASRLVFGAGAGTLVLNHTSSDYLFAPALSGTGSIEVEHGRTVLSGDSSAFAGTASIGTGTLAVNGLLGGAIDVGTAGRLQGTGTVGHTTVSGTVAPGNSIGTLHVDGDIGFHPGSVYEVEVNAAGQSDRIAATGNATLDGGTVRVLAGSGGYAPLTRYTILTADGGRTGAFDGVASNLAFLDPSLDYDANSVYLTMQRNDTSFAGIGQTRNQIAAGGGAESLGLGNPVHAAVVGLSAAQARAAFDQLSGEVHASARAALVEDSRFVRDAANDRIRAAFDGVAASGAPAAAACGNGAARGAGAGGTAGCAVWGRGFGSWGHAGGDGNAARLDRSTGGFLIGVDAPAFDGWRLGAVMGYSHTRFDVKDRGASGSSDNYHLGLYGGSRWGTLSLRAGAAYTWHDIATHRLVAFPGVSDSPAGSYGAGTVQVFGELGHGIDAGNARFEPFASLAYVHLHARGFTEKGGAAALAGASSNTETAFTTLGLRGSTRVALAGAGLTARAMVGWRHAFGNATPLAALGFASGGNTFSIGGVPIARDAAVIEASVDYALTPAATLGISYAGQFGARLSDQSVRASLSVRF